MNHSRLLVLDTQVAVVEDSLKVFFRSRSQFELWFIFEYLLILFYSGLIGGRKFLFQVCTEALTDFEFVQSKEYRAGSSVFLIGALGLGRKSLGAFVAAIKRRKGHSRPVFTTNFVSHVADF